MARLLLLLMVLLGPVSAVAQGITRLPNAGRKEITSTNYVRQSDKITTGTAATSPWVLQSATATTTAAIFTQGKSASGYAEVTSSIFSGNIAQAVPVPSGRSFVASVWAAKPSGTGYVYLWFDCVTGTPTSCSCSRKSGGACTATTFGGTACYVYATDLGVTEDRIANFFTCPTAITTGTLYLGPGNLNVAVGTTRFAGAQVQPGTVLTSLITTGATARTRLTGSTSR